MYIQKLKRTIYSQAINTSGIKKTSVEFNVSNIDKTPTRLVVTGERSLTNPNQITLDWNYQLQNGQLTCTSHCRNYSKSIIKFCYGTNHYKCSKCYL